MFCTCRLASSLGNSPERLGLILPTVSHSSEQFTARPVASQASRRIEQRLGVRKNVLCGAGFDPNPKTEKAESTATEDAVIDLDDSEIERRLLQRRRRRKAKAEKSSSTEMRTDADSLPDEANVELETNIIYFLGSAFGLIILNGLIIASSGFLPDEADAFVAQYLYPSFSPLVIVFLVCSALYGVWKTRFQKKDGQENE